MENSDFLILHISDLHFGADSFASFSRPESDIKSSIINIIKDTLENDFKIKKIVVAIGGDILNRGNADQYGEALTFFEKLRGSLVGFTLNFILCPGNHDLKNSGHKDFSLFNRFSTKLTNSMEFIFNKTNSVRLFEMYNYSFILINTQYHLKHEFGLINHEHFEEVAAKANHPLIILLHHNLIPIHQENLSTVRNSYPFLDDCISLGNVRMILHGHVHSSFMIKIGVEDKTFPIIGVGALLPELGGNYNNQFNIYQLNQSQIRTATCYRIFADSIKTSKLGVWPQKLL